MHITRQLLERYHLGLCTTEEKQAIDAWLEDGHVLDGVEPERRMNEKMLAGQNIRRFLRQRTGVGMAVNTAIAQRQRPNRYLTMYQVLAAVLLLALLPGIWFFADPFAPTARVVFNKIQVPLGKKSKLVLPDGTLVYLNSGSILTYHKKFTDSVREVSLTGEAFFTIAKHPRKPFIVNSSWQTRVRVLATAFNVQAYATESSVEVSVQEGKVQFLDIRGQTNALLIAGQSARYFPSEKLIKRNGTEVARTAWAWKDNTLVFKGEKLGDIVQQLERWYNVKVGIRNMDLASLRYTGTYKDPDLYHLLKSMGFVLGFNYKITENGKLIEIY